MKKLALALAVTSLFAAGDLFAQYTPGKGNVSLEVQFNPFDQKGNTFKLDGLKFRYFINEKNALRLKLGFSCEHNNIANEDEVETSENSRYEYSNRLKSTTGDLKLDLGYERHFKLAKRLNIYVGATFGFDRRFASTNFDNESVTKSRSYNHVYNTYEWIATKTKFNGSLTNGVFEKIPESNELYPLSYATDRAFWRINAAIITGLDFYVYKGLYLGTELGLKVGSLKYSDMEYEYKLKKDNETTESEFESTDDSRLTSCKLYIEPVLRLGWTF